MLDSLRRWRQRQQFCPSRSGLLVNPFWIARRELGRHIGELAPRITGRVLDVGCGQQPYRGLFKVSEYVGLELRRPDDGGAKRPDVLYDGSRFPFVDSSFDSAVAFEVLEHVFEPAELLTELRRVLRPGGRLLLTLPLVWDEHEQPWDYARYTSFGLRHLLAVHGFETEEQRKSVADLRVLFQLFNAYVSKVVQGRGRLATLAAQLLLIVPSNLIGSVLGSLLPSNPDLYLDNVVVARRGEAP